MSPMRTSFIWPTRFLQVENADGFQGEEATDGSKMGKIRSNDSSLQTLLDNITSEIVWVGDMIVDNGKASGVLLNRTHLTRYANSFRYEAVCKYGRFVFDWMKEMYPIAFIFINKIAAICYIKFFSLKLSYLSQLTLHLQPIAYVFGYIPYFHFYPQVRLSHCWDANDKEVLSQYRE